MDWVNEAKRLFVIHRPQHFTDYLHCEECFEHDETLRRSSIETIGIAELGNPGWDPMCFCTTKGLLYFMPALVRLCLTTISSEFYVEQFLFHMESSGKDHDLYHHCSPQQREFIASFIQYLMLNHANELESNMCEDDAMRVYEVWAA